jgi:hypothetical protein
MFPSRHGAEQDKYFPLTLKAGEDVEMGLAADVCLGPIGEDGSPCRALCGLMDCDFVVFGVELEVVFQAGSEVCKADEGSLDVVGGGVRYLQAGTGG